jgi:diguanylate cyclase
MWMNRLRAEDRVALVVGFAVVAVAGIAPFALYRLFRGEYVIAAIDLLVIGCLVSAALHSVRTGKTARASLFLAATCSAGCVSVAYMVGPQGLSWIYPVLIANFLLATRRQAVALGALAILAVMGASAAVPTLTDKLMFAIPATVASLCAYMFAWRAEHQRTQLEAMASRDPLTGAHNRRGLQSELAIAMAASTREGTPLGLLVFDIDHFKAINDAHGHEAGDEVLVRIADVVDGITRKGDRFFRLGGEEFALLVPGADPQALRAIAEKLRTRVEAGVDCRGMPVTISIGATPFLAGESDGDWLARADAAMYSAKRCGRNRTMVVAPGLAAPGVDAARADTPGRGA